MPPIAHETTADMTAPKTPPASETCTPSRYDRSTLATYVTSRDSSDAKARTVRSPAIDSEAESVAPAKVSWVALDTRSRYAPYVAPQAMITGGVAIITSVSFPAAPRALG